MKITPEISTKFIFMNGHAKIVDTKISKTLPAEAGFFTCALKKQQKTNNE